MGKAASIKPIELAVIPDVDEHETPRLTEPERREIELPARQSLSRSCVRSALRVQRLPCSKSASYSFVVGKTRHIAVARRLRRDWQAVVVKEGRPASGTPWVAGGLPAPWRLGHGVRPAHS